MKTSLLLLVLLCGSAEAAVYNLHLVTDNVPDYTSLESLVQSSTGQWQTPQDKSIAVWRWGRRSRRQTSCATEDGRYILDPVLHYNSYGAMNCGIISLLNIASWRQLGYQGRYIQLGDHTVSEVSWDSGRTWHLFDSSMSVFCFNHAGEVASCREIQESHACELSGGKSEPGHYYLYHYARPCGSHPGPTGWRCAADQPVEYNRTLEAGASSYTDGFSVDEYCQAARWGQRYTLNLRSYESYTRYWEPLDDVQRKGDNSANDPAYFRPMTDGSDPDDQHGLNNLRGNGRWLFQPDLSVSDCRRVFYRDEGVTLRAEDGAGPNLHPTQAGSSAWVIFKVYAANVITSMRIEADGTRGGDTDLLRILVSRDAGLNWNPVWVCGSTGPQTARVALRDEVAGVTQCLIKIAMQAARSQGDVGLDALRVTTITQVNRLTLPKLTLGVNQVLLRADDQVETTELWPALHAGAYRRTVAAEDSVYSDKQPDGMYKATLGAGVDGRECSVTWRLEVPTDITGVTYAAVSTNRSPRSYVSLRHSWDGSQFRTFHLNRDGDFPFDEQVLCTLAGSEVPAAARQAYFRGVFFCTSGAGTYNMPGIQDLLMRVAHKPRDAAFEPIEVTYCWTEHREDGDVTRTHTELVRSLPHRYAIHIAGRRDPTLHWVRINFQGHGPESASQRYGYSDGADVGTSWERPKVTYRWDEPLAVGKPYTASRASNSSSGNPDGGRELTNGIVIAPTDQATGKNVQEATAFWEAGEPTTFVVDLERECQVAGVCVSTHQPNGRFCHPAGIEVAVSRDAHEWLAGGMIRQDDLWNPPGDYEAWEHDDDPQYAALPAGGRLAYSFPLAFQTPVTGRYVRLICTPVQDRGMGLSELAVFGKVEVRSWPGDVTLPDLASLPRLP
ncbi:MAG: hypothetical protein A2Y77_15915 [Planctomycetes bacterium RBG_13_62_9]|nr:MAG: hypothetical protein A2Y77_15915 [Planctomycetes bacterium RBG_13_62_9]